MRPMRVAVRPFGVLGTRLMAASGAVKKVAPAPPPGLPILDPAGLTFINQGPQGAGGASGQIYRFLGIDGDSEFPAPVRAAIQRPIQAKLHYHGLNAASMSSARTFPLGQAAPRRRRFVS